jgi:hypothetical protein
MTYAATVAGDSPVAWWKLNETVGTTATDSGSGTAANGTYTNTWTYGLSGIDSADAGGGTSVKAGTNGYITVGALPAKLQFASGTSFSIEAWCAFQGSAPGPALVTEAFAGDGTVRYMLGFYNGSSWTDFPSFGWYNGSWRLIQSATGIGNGLWHHVVGTFDGTQLRLYVDGSLVAGPTTPGGTQPGGTETLYIGRRWDSGTYFDDGWLDEVAMYSVALSSTQVSNHYGARNTTADPLRVTSVWAEAALTGIDPAVRVTGVWAEVAIEEFWHGFGTPEIGDDALDVGGISSGGSGFIIQSGAAAGRGKGRSKAAGIRIIIGTGPAYRKNVDYRNNSDYRG